jgi:alkyl hydroperoxide reductase 1
MAKLEWWLILRQLFLSDPGTAFSKKLDWTLGERTARYALVIDHGKIVYAEKEPGREVTVSSAEAVLAKL